MMRSTELNDAQSKVLALMKTNPPRYEHDTLESLQKQYPDIFKDVTPAQFETDYKNNDIAVIRGVYAKQSTGMSDEDIKKWYPRGCPAVFGEKDYLKAARDLRNNDIYKNPDILDTDKELLAAVEKLNIKTVLAAVETLEPNFIASVMGLVGDAKKKLIDAIKGELGVSTPPFVGVLDKRAHELGNLSSTDQQTPTEEMKKTPHKIKAFGEPRNTADPQYPHNHITMTDGGHIMELDDTPESPRMRLQHTNGSGIQVNGDGHFIRKTTQDNYDIHDEDAYKVVKGTTTQVHNKQVMKTYEEGVLYKVKQAYTDASERVHYQTPVLSYNNMMLGKNAVFSNTVMVKTTLTAKDIVAESSIRGKNATFVVTKSNWNNALSREATVAWDINTGGGDMDTGEAPATPSEDRPLINKSLQFKAGAAGNPTFIKPTSFDDPITVVGGTIAVVGGVLLVNGSPYNPPG